MGIRLAITCGDPAGIGPEVAAGWLRKKQFDDPTELVLIGYDHWIRQNLPHSRCEFVSIGDPEFVPIPGQPTPAGAQIAWDALEAAAAGADEGRWKGVVTGPVSKAWMQRVGFRYPGQTEFFADRWGGEPTMAFAGDRMRLALVTWHVPLREVPEALGMEALERTIGHANQLLIKMGIRTPKIGVCGLNPHAGEGGTLGTEEYNILDPALDTLRPAYPGLSPCLPADTVFWRHLQGDFDLVVALYHDQGLGPLKTLEFDRAVNLTLGLRHIRTSPDHGTAFNLAGKGEASDTSFARAIDYARLLAGTTWS